MTYEDLPWDARERFHKRAASLNRLADAFGLLFAYNFDTEVTTPFVSKHRLLVPTKDIGQP